MKKSPHHIKHKQKKAIRKAQREEAYESKESKIKETQKKTYLSSSRNVKISKAKASSKHKHHLTSPTEVDWETEPESIHQTGKQWIGMIQKKTLNAAIRLQKKIQKFPFLKRKK